MYLDEVKSPDVSAGAVTYVYSIVLDCRRKLFGVCTESVAFSNAFILCVTLHFSVGACAGGLVPGSAF